MSNRAYFDVDADGLDVGFDAAAGQVLAFTLRVPTGVRSWQLQVWDAAGFDAANAILANPPRQSPGATDLVLDNGAGDTGTLVAATTPAAAIGVTLPVGEASSWLVRSIVDGGTTVVNGRSVIDPEKIWERMVVIRNGSNLRQIVATENAQYDPEGVALWAKEMIAALAAGGILAPPANPADDGKVAIASAGNLSYALIGTANIATSANIAASQLNPGGANTVLAGGTPNTWTATPTVTSLAATRIGIGTAVDAAVAGAFESTTADAASWPLTAQNSSNVQGLSVDGTGKLLFAGSATRAAGIAAFHAESGGDGVAWIQSTVGDFAIAASGVGKPLLLYANTAGGRVKIGTTAGYAIGLDLGADASDYIAFGADPADSGSLRFSAGCSIMGEPAPAGADLNIIDYTDDTACAFGDVGIALVSLNGTTVEINGASATMIEAVEVAAGRRVVSLALGADLTTTEMPANTGDRVVYIANAATVPTGTPVSGGILYSSGGNIYWRDASGISSQLN